MIKKALREQLREALSSVPPAQLHEHSHRACALLAETQEYRQAEIIMVFLSLPTEVDTTPLVLRAWRDCKRVLAPRVSFEQRRILPIEIESLSDDLLESPLGIREPAQGVPFPTENIDLVIVPGLGFDHAGNRIGRGRGFYDHFLAHDEWKGTSCGFAFESQVVDQVPVTDHDMKVDMLVTDEQVRRLRPVGASLSR